MCQFLIYKTAQLLALLLPLRIAYKTAAFVSTCQFYVSGKDRRAVIENLKVVFKIDDESKLREPAKEIFVNFARYLVDFFRFSRLNENYIAQNVSIVGRDILDAALKEGKGAILFSAHLGNYELGGGVVSLLGYPFNVVALDHKSRLVNEFFIKQRERLNVKVIPLGAALKRCYSSLKKGEILGILGDRDFLNNGIRVKFFGKDCLIPKGAAILSMRTQAVIIPTFFVRLPNDTFELIFEKPVSCSTTDNFEDDVRRITEKLVRILEEKIRKYPYQWYMFRNLWV